MDKYMKRSFTKLRTALAILIACCLTTDMYAQTAVAADSVATDTVAQLVSGVNTVWMLLAAMLVFFMQPGFALVEAGFTRTKNTANILMKNFVDFMFGSLLYWLVGFGIMFGLGDFFGTPHLMSLLFDSNGLPDPAYRRFPRIPNRILRHFRHNCFGSYSGAYKVFHVSGLHNLHQRTDLSRFRALDLGWWMADER